jgi:hypothetical protein
VLSKYISLLRSVSDLWKTPPIPLVLKGKKPQSWTKQGSLPVTTEKAQLRVEKAADISCSNVEPNSEKVGSLTWKRYLFSNPGQKVTVLI